MTRYSSLHPTRQNLTHGLFYSGGFREEVVRLRAETRALLDLCLSSAHLEQCDPDEQAGFGLTRCCVSPVRVPIHSLN